VTGDAPAPAAANPDADNFAGRTGVPNATNGLDGVITATPDALSPPAALVATPPANSATQAAPNANSGSHARRTQRLARLSRDTTDSHKPS